MNKVSVIIPFYNNIDQLLIAVNSVKKQTYQNIEIILVDDGSEEDFTDIIENIKKGSNVEIKHIKQKNSGPGLARQKGLNLATGKYIQYLDSDDEILPNKLKVQVGILNKNPKVIMVYGLSQMNGDSSKLHRKKHFKGNENNVLESAIQKRKWHTSSCLWSYDTSLVYWEDLTNGEDVLHDVNAGLLNKNKSVIHHSSIVSNIKMDNSSGHLSNAINDISKHEKLVKDASELNNRIYKKLVEHNLINDLSIREPLVERCFFEGLKFYKLGFKNDGKKMLELGVKLNTNAIKYLELKSCQYLAKLNKLSPKNISFLFKLHRLLVAERIHQRRAL